MKPIISGAKFIEFKNPNDVFYGILGNAVIREKDGPNVATNPNEKSGAIMGYEMTDKNGLTHILGNSAVVKNAVEKVGEGAILRVEFLGKGVNAKNQPVNLFKIDQLDDEKEWNELDPIEDEHEIAEEEPVKEPVKKGKK